jgi:hypothetical protein
VPALFGLRPDGGDAPFYLRNASLFVLPLLTVYFIWKRGSGVASALCSREHKVLSVREMARA